MSALITALVSAIGMFSLALWIERRERVVAPDDGNYRTSRKPLS
jgi:hypothetical protein